ncbi:MAG: hypothetical protein R3C32_08140 [Chloroflexota bacterium]
MSAQVLQRIVDDSLRLLRADDAHLTLLVEGTDYLVPAVLAGGTDDATREWLMSMEFPLGAGSTAWRHPSAASSGRPTTSPTSASPGARGS